MPMRGAQRRLRQRNGDSARKQAGPFVRATRGSHARRERPRRQVENHARQHPQGGAEDHSPLQARVRLLRLVDRISDR